MQLFGPESGQPLTDALANSNVFVAEDFGGELRLMNLDSINDGRRVHLALAILLA